MFPVTMNIPRKNTKYKVSDIMEYQLSTLSRYKRISEQIRLAKAAANKYNVKYSRKPKQFNHLYLL